MRENRLQAPGDARRDDNRRMLVRLSIVAVAMFGFGFALVPFYEQICAALGVNSLVPIERSAARNTQIDRTRTVSIEFDANSHDLPWRFRPLVRHVQVHPGELTTIEYEVVNVRGHAVTGQAVPSYGPTRAGEYFRKVDCFCFEQQTLAAGEVRRMPVVFVVDPALPKDVSTITLSYTFFEVAGRGGKS
ncbi:MAG: cytochrome c oxidase assembly protein [Burkholderiales bacterium]|nr:cytochrome c oxidase assembly protein [Burkholderiales bacterium]